MRYTLIISNDQGASETTNHQSKAEVRRQIRTWDAKYMTACVLDADSGDVIYEGSALSFK